jgi:hypothetical protein
VIPAGGVTAQTHTRKVRPRKVAVSKVTNARDALAQWGRGVETYCLTFGQFSLMDAIEAILEVRAWADRFRPSRRRT